MGCGSSKSVDVSATQNAGNQSSENNIKSPAVAADNDGSSHCVPNEPLISDPEDKIENSQSLESDTPISKNPVKHEVESLPSETGDQNSLPPSEASTNSELLEIEENLAAVTVLDVLKSITNVNMGKQVLDAELATKEYHKEPELAPVSPCKDIEVQGESPKIIQDTHVPSPSAMPLSSDTNDNRFSDFFHSALSKTCALSNNEKLIPLASKSSCLKMEYSLSNFGQDDLISKIVCEMSSLTTLDLSRGLCGPVTFRAILSALMNDKHVKSLSMCDNLATPDCAELIGKLLSCNKVIESLDVSSNQLGKEALSRHIGAALKNNVTLKSLNISSCGATDLHCLCESIRNYTGNSLKSLIASHNHITDGNQFAIDLSLIIERETCQITHLDVTDTGITAMGMKNLISSIRSSKTLLSLKVGKNRMESIVSIGEMLVNASLHPTLEELALSKTTFERDVSDDFELICDHSSSPMSPLTHLELADCSLNTRILDNLSPVLMERLCNVVELDLSQNNDLSAKDILLFSKLCNSNISSLKLALYEQASEIPSILSSGFTKLLSLDLRRAKINATALKEVVTACQHHLQDLILNGIKLSGFGALDTISKASNLQSLFLSGCQMNDTDVEPLVNAVSKTSPFLSLRQIDLSVNRISSIFLVSFVDALLCHKTHPLSILNLANNNIDGTGLEALSKLFSSSDHETKLKRVDLSCNCIEGPSAATFFTSFQTKENQDFSLDLRNQKESFEDDDIEIIAREIKRLLFDGQCSQTAKLSINLSGLGGLDLSDLNSMDSGAIRTDFVNLRKPSITLHDAFEISRGLVGLINHSKPVEPLTISSEIWKSIVGKEAPTWAFLDSELKNAVYITHMPGTVTLQRLQAILEMEADCSVKDVYLVMDPVVRKPTGSAWVLFSDGQSKSTALQWFTSGGAQMYGTPFVISGIPVSIIDENACSRDAANEDILQREKEQKKKLEEDRRLLEESQNLAAERAEYRQAHPAYQNGRIS